TNEPFVATRGTFIRVEPLLHMRDRASAQNPRPPQPLILIAGHTDTRGVDVTAVRHWELSDASSVFAGFLGGWASGEDRQSPSSRPDVHTRSSYEIVKGGYSFRHVAIEGRVVASQLPGELE